MGDLRLSRLVLHECFATAYQKDTDDGGVFYLRKAWSEVW